MVNNQSAQVMVEVRMKRSPNFFGNLILQEFKLEPLQGERRDWPILAWNNTILKNSSLQEWTNGDVTQTIEGLKRNVKYNFSIGVITQLTKSWPCLSHKCEVILSTHKCEGILSTAVWPCRKGNQSISSKKVINN